MQTKTQLRSTLIAATCTAALLASVLTAVYLAGPVDTADPCSAANARAVAAAYAGQLAGASLNGEVFDVELRYYGDHEVNATAEMRGSDFAVFGPMTCTTEQGWTPSGAWQR